MFGVGRSVWASNYPVDGFGGISYNQNFMAYKVCLERLNVSEVFFSSLINKKRWGRERESGGGRDQVYFFLFFKMWVCVCVCIF